MLAAQPGSRRKNNASSCLVAGLDTATHDNVASWPLAYCTHDFHTQHEPQLRGSGPEQARTRGPTRRSSRTMSSGARQPESHTCCGGGVRPMNPSSRVLRFSSEPRRRSAAASCSASPAAASSPSWLDSCRGSREWDSRKEVDRRRLQIGSVRTVCRWSEAACVPTVRQMLWPDASLFAPPCNQPIGQVLAASRAGIACEAASSHCTNTQAVESSWLTTVDFVVTSMQHR